MNKREPTASEVATWLSQQGAACDNDGHISLDDITPVTINRLEVGEGCCTLSWIWFSVRSIEATTDLAETLHQSLRVEWAKCRAC